jgi:hypothetical protein
MQLMLRQMQLNLKDSRLLQGSKNLKDNKRNKHLKDSKNLKDSKPLKDSKMPLKQRWPEGLWWDLVHSFQMYPIHPFQVQELVREHMEMLALVHRVQ